ncbi:DivIVA domain-containing protein [Clostridium brassicae]|uniref:DivIVA domain-containing protein n=1 Tax=Clostridium brassicae TaxID=2999072 RepID=A0ABT4DF65_9CLOT|nr:DivIVA domain-containing protein [Clostridium brassicae]MCY6959644.1 DivIVA domain-containing protein [Clostridium brassicae]
MVITSMDINNKEFKKSLRGYDCEEVDEFLDKLSEDYEVLYKENSGLKEKIELMEEKVTHYSKIETTIQNTLILAQNAAEQARQTAQSEADLIIKRANDSAQRIIDKAHNDVVKINDDYEKLKQEFVKFRTKYKNFMNTQFDTFESLEKDFLRNYNVGEVVDTRREELQPKEIENIPENIKEEKVDSKQKEVDEYTENDLDLIKSFFANKVE